MAVTLSAWRVVYPEFNGARDPLVQASLDFAAIEVDAEVWGTKTDHGIGLLAAHYLALSPYGQNARMVAKDGSTTYGKSYESLRDSVAAGLRIF
jgi:hypothetical protein